MAKGKELDDAILAVVDEQSGRTEAELVVAVVRRLATAGPVAKGDVRGQLRALVEKGILELRSQDMTQGWADRFGGDRRSKGHTVYRVFRKESQGPGAKPAG